MCFYQRESLPGYSAIFRHANDELNYCYYLIPCGKDGMCGNVSVRAPLRCTLAPHELITSSCSSLGHARQLSALSCESY